MKTLPLLFALGTPLLAQVYTPPAPNNQSNNTPPSDTVVRQPAANNRPSTNNNSGLLGNEIGFFDPTNDTISWNGSTWAASNNRIFEARFEKYLNEPEENSISAKQYRETIEEILDALSPHRKGGPTFRDAVSLLPKAASYPGDSKLCDSLSNAIYTAVLAKRDVQKGRDLIEAMEREKKSHILDADWKARTERDPSVGKANTGAGRAQGEGKNEQSEEASQVGRGAQSLAYAEHLRRIAEIEASKKTREMEHKVKTELAKIQYQALMVQFFVQRRFKHVVMASRFYNMLWSDGDGTLYIDDKSDINKMFSESLGVSPTVSTLDSLANEAMRDIDKGVEAFVFLVERGELESASKRLAESYLVGEFMPSINTLEREKKRKVLTFVRGSYVLLNAIDAKDYAKASEQVTILKEQASDFDATKAEAAIATYTRASDMAINAAKIHFANSENDLAQTEIQKAMELWPQNPKLAEFDRLVEAGSTLVQLRNDFDRLFAEQNYREVFKRQHELAASIKDDAERQAKFRQVLENITDIEKAVGSAQELSDFGQVYAAWERLSEVHDRFPDDPVLNQVMTSLAPKVADFTKAIDQAAAHEQRGNQGSALSWYYKARHLHPGSKTAEEAIERLVTKALQ